MEKEPPFELSGTLLDDFAYMTDTDVNATSVCADERSADDLEGGSVETVKEDRVLKALEFAHIPMMILNEAGRILSANKACALCFRGFDPLMAVGQCFSDFLREHFQFITVDFRHRMSRVSSFSVRLPDVSGLVSWRICLGELEHQQRYVVLHEGGQNAGLSDSFTEETEWDALTGLGNAKMFARLVDESDVVGALNQRAVLLVDFEQFHQINDTYGREVGDRILQLAAARLRRAIRPGDPILRLNGDEFVVLLEGDLNVDGVSQLASRVNDLMSRTFLAHGERIDVTVNVGIALSDAQKAHWKAVVAQARDALTALKSTV